MGSGSPSGSIRVDISLARYGGDWDCSPTAMLFLGHKMEERTGLAFEISDRVVSLDSPEIMKLPFIYLTGHRDFALSGAEIARLRQYLKGGGHLWADDSTHFNDHAFDRAFRREIQRVLPDLRIQRLSTEFAGFKTGYDLSRGYRGYAVPPGDKYRQDYIEGIEINGRVAVVYTRNDYGDGLNIDPNTHPLMTSLTNLSPAEMQEGSLRMGINLVLYFLGNQLGGDDMLAAVAQGLDTTESLAEVVLPKGTSTILAPTDQAGVWVPESWGDTASLTTDERGTTIAFTVSDKQKVALTHTGDPTALASSDVVLADIHNALPCGIRVALGLVDKERYFETKPYFLKPGDNTAVFDLGEKDFKSEASNWEYTAALPQPYQVERLTILLYAPRAGAVTIRNLRAVTPH